MLANYDDDILLSTRTPSPPPPIYSFYPKRKKEGRKIPWFKPYIHQCFTIPCVKLCDTRKFCTIHTIMFDIRIFECVFFFPNSSSISFAFWQQLKNTRLMNKIVLHRPQIFIYNFQRVFRFSQNVQVDNKFPLFMWMRLILAVGKFPFIQSATTSG